MGRDSKKSLKVSRIATNPELQHSRPCTHAGIVTGERVEAIAYQIRLFLPVGLVSEMRMGNGTELGGKSGMCVSVGDRAIYIYMYIIRFWGKRSPEREMLCKRPEKVERSCC